MSAFLYFASFMLVGSSPLPVLVLKSVREPWRYAAVAVMLGLALFFFMLARSLRRFSPWARVAAMGVSCVGVFVFPLGTVIFSPFFYVLIKAKHLFARDGALGTARPTQLCPQPANISAPDIDRLAA